MRKAKGLALLFLLGMIFSVSFASAQYFYLDFRSASEQLITWVQDILGPFFAIFLGTSEFLFERILFLFIVVSIVYLVLGRIKIFEDKPGARWVVTLAVSLLSVRFLSQTDYVQAILLPYSVLGAVLTAGIPIIILFFFIQSFDNDLLRKLLWTVTTVIYFGIWISSYPQVGRLSWIYFVAAIISLIFLLADGTIRRVLIKQQMKQLDIHRREDLEREIRKKIRDADLDLTNKIIIESQHNRIVKNLKSQLREIQKL